MSILIVDLTALKATTNYSEVNPILTRLHNNANVLCLGARVLGAGLALDLVDAFVDAEFEGDRHIKRLSLIEDIENEKQL